MTIFRAFAAGAALLTAAPAALAGQDAPALAARAVRFWLPEYGQTVVKAFVQIPYAVLTPTDGGPAGEMAYRVSVRVADSTGLTLMQQSWMKHAPAAARLPGATGLEILEFNVVPGKYRLELAVDDSVSATHVGKTLEFQGFTGRPDASDLVLSSRMRVPGAADTVPVPGELRRGNTILTALADVHLAPLDDRSRLFYYLEAYPAQADSGTLALEVVSREGQSLLKVPARPVQVGAGGGVLRGQLDLTGLPEGEYDLVATLALASGQVTRRAPFTMGDLGAALAQAESRRAEAMVTDSGYFGAMDQDELEEAFAPLSYVARPNDQLQVWGAQLSLQAKRRFLTRFWQQRDTLSPGTPRNEVREAFYQRIAEANRRFTDQQRGSGPGWRSDQGRIFIRNGEPIEVLRRSNVGTAPPYEVWRYAGSRDRWYIFSDRTNFGSYELLNSNDPKESSRPGWEQTLGPEALVDIGQYLNIDFVRRARSRVQ
ncbi:MAG TPA: GWxTD domain-containing protein [Gemmatimonadales bacterium]|nr:GWxTD domain-containing protein [Gemmatimonadales bacterium]